MSSASGRLAWAAQVVDPRRGERVLEIGCGHGVLVDLVAAAGADVVGVDRSAVMTAAAVRRNAAAVDGGRVHLLTGSLVDVPLDGRFDAVVAFDVRALWTPPAPEWDVVAAVLAPAGRVVVAFSVMDEDAAEGIADAVERLAADRGLVPHRRHRTATGRYPSAAVELRGPAPHG